MDVRSGLLLVRKVFTPHVAAHGFLKSNHQNDVYWETNGGNPYQDRVGFSYQTYRELSDLNKVPYFKSPPQCKIIPHLKEEA